MTTTWRQAKITTSTGGEGIAKAALPAILDAPGGATTNADFSTAMTTATTGFVALMGGSTSYNTSTGAITGTVGTSGGSVTISQSNGNALLALMSTVGVDGVAGSAGEAQSSSVLVGYDAALSVSAVKRGLRAIIDSLGN